ncbi:MAG: hypothetical protein R2828_14820 [Saprospiraceae bacterium]
MNGKFNILYLIAFFLLTFQFVMAQANENLPYYEIPAYPEKYNACTVTARVIDGLGFRYYWATEGLRPEDLDFKPSQDARTTKETLDHIYGLVNVVANAVKQVPNTGDLPALTFAEQRRQTLLLLKETSDMLKASKPKQMKRFKMIFQREGSSTEYPFWNELNGPLSDALWHVGQVVSFRRSSGNPFNSKASVLQGKLRE